MSEVALTAYLMDHAFQGSEFHSLMHNLATIDEATWQRPLPGSVRTIAEITMHVASSKIMYVDYAFGTASLTWEHPSVEPWSPAEVAMADAIAFLREAHQQLMAQVRPLSDGDLVGPRLANWGEQKETRWLLSTLLQHDVYHAGEINRIRSVLAGEDRWQWQIDLGITR